MFQFRSRDNAKALVSLRYTDEWVGFFVLLSLLIFGGAIIEAGILRDWLTPPARLHVVLPLSGGGGLIPGGEVHLMGARAGTIRSVKLDPSGSMYANVDIDPQAKPFIRRDSQAIIRRQLIVTGAAYIDLSRGYGAPMDWKYAVVTATPAPNPADQVTATLATTQSQVMPALQSGRHVMDQLDTTVSDLNAGKGTMGQLLRNDQLMRDAQKNMQTLNDVLTRIKPIENQLTHVMGTTNHAMSNLDVASEDVRKASPDLQAISSHLKTSSANLPVLLSQAQDTLYGLQQLTAQLRGLWFLGGNKEKVRTSTSLPPSVIEP